MLQRIADSVRAGERITPDDALRLFGSDDLFLLGRLAAERAVRKNGRKAYFVRNIHINPTNICVNRCRFCAFSRSAGEEGAYELTIQEILRKLGGAKRDPRSSRLAPRAFSEVHIVGGLHPDWPFEHYLDMISSIKKRFPKIHVKAFTAVEIDHFSRLSGLSLYETLTRLREHGLDAMPGGGAEILRREVREILCPEKISGERWLEVMEAAHRVGIRSNATMLYGHVESLVDRIDHLSRLRDLQDRTAGFQAFIPLSYHPKNTDMEGTYTSGIDDLKTMAVSRIFLDNFDHIKAYWIMLGEKLSQVALAFGADDIDGTIIEEKITHAAGALTGERMTGEALTHLIRKAGKVPVERDALYRRVRA